MTKTTSPGIETPSGKGSGDENFPVGSFLLPRRLRPHVAKYYSFARAIDDIADNGNLEPGEKIERLEGFARALKGNSADPDYGKAIVLGHSLAATGVNPKHALDLISAFKQDAVKLRYKNWDELMNYCNRSAAPVGRYLLVLHSESEQAFRYSDALCNALQVINHLQDCKDDYLSLDRVYLPQDRLSANGTETKDLDASRSSPGLLKTIRECVAKTRELMVEAHRLPRHLKSRPLAMESAVIIRIADRLLDKLEVRDPVAVRVELNKVQFFICMVRGVFSVLLGSGPGYR